MILSLCHADWGHFLISSNGLNRHYNTLPTLRAGQMRKRRAPRGPRPSAALRPVRAPPPGVCRPHPGHPGWVVRPHPLGPAVPGCGLADGVAAPGAPRPPRPGASVPNTYCAGPGNLVGPEMVKLKFFKSSRMDLSGPGIGSMELVSFWPFPMVVGMKQPLRTRWLLCSP